MTPTRSAPTEDHMSRLLRVVALLLVLWMAATGCGDQPNEPYTERSARRTYLDQAPGVPLVLATTLPAPYVFLGPGFEQSSDDRMFVRTMDFRLDSGSTSKVIELGVAEPASPVSTCAPAGSESQTVSRVNGADPVWIRPLGEDVLTTEECTFWATVPLSDNLDAVTWLT